MSDQIVLAQIVLPPSEEHCTAGLCGQKACCDVEIRIGAADRVDPEQEEYWVGALCQPHALFVLTAPLEHTTKHFPPEQVGVPPWDARE